MNCILNGLGASKYVAQRQGAWVIGDFYGTETPFRDGITIKY